MAVSAIGFAAALHFVAVAIHHDVSVLDDVALRVALAQPGANARQQFLDRKRFGDVVVGADVEARDAVGDAVVGGQHDDRHAALGANALADFDAVHSRQHQVEDDEVGLFEGLFEAGEPVARDVDLVAFVLEFELQDAADRRVVLDDEDPIRTPFGRYAILHRDTLSDVLSRGPVRACNNWLGKGEK